MRRIVCSWLLCVPLLTAGPKTSRAAEPASPASATPEKTSGLVPWVVSLFPENGRSSEHDRARRAGLELHLAERLAPLFAGTPYGSVRVDVISDWEQAADTLRKEASQIVECDPVLYFATVSARENVRARYRVALQQVSPDPPRAEVLVLEGAGIDRPVDLRSRRVGFIHRVAGGAARIQRDLNGLALAPGRDYEVRNAHYAENAFLCLKAGLIDAVVAPSNVAAAYLAAHPFPPVRVVHATKEILPPLFALRREDADRYSVLAHGAVEVLRSFLGPENAVSADDDLYDAARQEGVLWEGF